MHCYLLCICHPPDTLIFVTSNFFSASYKSLLVTMQSHQELQILQAFLSGSKPCLRSIGALALILRTLFHFLLEMSLFHAVRYTRLILGLTDSSSVIRFTWWLEASHKSMTSSRNPLLVPLTIICTLIVVDAVHKWIFLQKKSLYHVIGPTKLILG